MLAFQAVIRLRSYVPQGPAHSIYKRPYSSHRDQGSSNRAQDAAQLSPQGQIQPTPSVDSIWKKRFHPPTHIYVSLSCKSRTISFSLNSYHHLTITHCFGIHEENFDCDPQLQSAFASSIEKKATVPGCEDTGGAFVTCSGTCGDHACPSWVSG